MALAAIEPPKQCGAADARQAPARWLCPEPALVRSSHARCPTNAECDGLQTNNTWTTRLKSGVPSPYVTYTGATINYINYTLCHGNGLSDPIQSSSSAWISVEGPGSSDIVQIGVIKCNSIASVCGNNMDEDQVDWFYAWGVDGDPFKQPWANRIGLADGYTHRYTVYLSSGSWIFSIDGTTKKTLSDSWRSWHAVRSEEAVEIHNEGDQLGGTSSNKQTFRGAVYKIGSSGTLYSDYGNVFKSGHCYPWVNWTQLSYADYDVWTNNSHGDC